MRLVLILILIQVEVQFAMAEPSFKKITVSKTNNTPSFVSDGKWVVEQGKPADLKKLKAYVMDHGFKAIESTEQELVIEALKWVNAQWRHDGMNEPPPKFHAIDILKSVHNDKQQYRCVEYGVVLAEVLQAYGFVTRVIALRTNEVAYGGFGQGHVAMEIWMNELNKWIFLDPQFGSYLTEKDSSTPLNYFELFQQKQAGKWDSLKVHFATGKDDAKEAGNYKNFLKDYFGHIKVSAGKDQPHICLLLEAKEQPLTFQGGISNNVVFTKDASLVYPEMNKVTLLLTYTSDAKNFQKMIAELNIKSNEDYLKNMGKFAAEPKFSVQIKSAGANDNGYEYRFDKATKWTFTKKPEFAWDATKDVNLVEVRSINPLNRPGPVTFMEIKYQ